MATNENALTPFIPTSIEQASKLSQQLAQSALLPDALRGKPADVLVTLITGHELGLSPMQAIRGLHVIKGKAVMSADLTVALVKKHAECLYFRLVETTAQRAIYATERKGEGETKMAFTIEDAARAGLTGGDNWKKYPAAMLRARCASALARAVYPDLTLGVYDPDEAREFSSGGGEPARVERDVTPPTNGANGKATSALKAKLAEKVAAALPVESFTVEPVEEEPPAPRPSPPRRMPPIVDESEPPPPSDEDAPSYHAETGEVLDEPEESVVMSFGSGSGKPLSELGARDLTWYAKALAENIEDPKRARFRADNEKKLAAIRREQQRRA
jgi:hypothetical protein